MVANENSVSSQFQSTITHLQEKAFNVENEQDDSLKKTLHINT